MPVAMGTLAAELELSSTSQGSRATTSSVFALAKDAMTPKSNKVAPRPGPPNMSDNAAFQSSLELEALVIAPEPDFVISTRFSKGVKGRVEAVPGVAGDGGGCGSVGLQGRVSEGGEAKLKPASSMRKASSMKKMSSMKKSASFAGGMKKSASFAGARNRSLTGEGGKGMQFALTVVMPEVKEPKEPINPDVFGYMVWWYFIVFMAMWCALMSPFSAAFGSNHGFSPYGSFMSINTYITTLVFVADIVVKFFVAYKDETGHLVTDFKRIAKKYLSFMFWLDLLFVIPFSGIVVLGCTAAGTEVDDNTAIYIGCLKFLTLGRLYRLFEFFTHLDHSLIVSQLALVLLRNGSYVFFSCHWFACIFYILAELEFNLGKASWLGNAPHRTDGQPLWVMYLYSLYFSVMAFSGLGDNDFFTASPAEAMVMVIYLIFNVVLNSYILGTITMLMVKGDEQSADFQERMKNLKEYSKANSIPENLQKAMADHLELHFLSVQTMEENVLDVYPEAIRRKVLCFLYIESMRDCYLFSGIKTKFMDSLLCASRIEMFMPEVQIMMSGDYLTELFIILDGLVEVAGAGTERDTRNSRASRSNSMLGGSMKTVTKSMNSTMSLRCDSTATVGSALAAELQTKADIRGVSNTFGEVPFFTEDVSNESAWTHSVVRVMVLSKDAFESLAMHFPHMARVILTNLQSKSAGEVRTSIWETISADPKSDEGLKAQVNEMVATTDGSNPFFLKDFSPAQLALINQALPPQQLAKLKQMTDINDAVVRYCTKLDEGQVHEMLYAAQLGDLPTIRKLVNQGIPPTCADYDNRSALMVAAHNGHANVVDYLVLSGADPDSFDNFGGTAMQEAIDNGHLPTAKVLMRHGAKLGIADTKAILAMTMFLENSDMEKLKYCLRAGANPNILNADGRTLLHYAARVGNLQAVKVLSDECPISLELEVADGHGLLPLEDAEKNGHVHTVAFLRHLIRTKPEREAKHQMISEAKAYAVAEAAEKNVAAMLLLEEAERATVPAGYTGTVGETGTGGSPGGLASNLLHPGEDKRLTTRLSNKDSLLQSRTPPAFQKPEDGKGKSVLSPNARLYGDVGKLSPRLSSKDMLLQKTANAAMSNGGVKDGSNRKVDNTLDSPIRADAEIDNGRDVSALASAQARPSLVFSANKTDNLHRKALTLSASNATLSSMDSSAPQSAIQSHHSLGILQVSRRASVTAVPREWSQPFSIPMANSSQLNFMDGGHMADDQAAVGGFQGNASVGITPEGSARTVEKEQGIPAAPPPPPRTSYLTELEGGFSIEPISSPPAPSVFQSKGSMLAALEKTTEHDYAQLDILMSDLTSSFQASPPISITSSTSIATAAAAVIVTTATTSVATTTTDATMGGALPVEPPPLGGRGRNAGAMGTGNEMLRPNTAVTEPGWGLTAALHDLQEEQAL